MKTTQSNYENQRLQARNTFPLIELLKEEDLDSLTSLAAEICSTKVSLISIVTTDRQWYLSQDGLEVGNITGEFGIYTQIILHSGEIVTFEDLRKEVDYPKNPLEIGEAPAVFLAGVPIITSQGIQLGAICIIDHQPKQLSERQIHALKKLANQTATVLELKWRQIELEKKSVQNELELELIHSSQHFNKIGAWEMDINTGITQWTDMLYEIHEVSRDFDHNNVNGIAFYHPDYRVVIREAISQAIGENKPFDVICKFVTAKGNLRWVRSTGKRIGNRLLGSFQDITELKQKQLKFEGIFNSSMSFIGFLNPEGILLEANDTALQMAGLTREDVVGKYFWDCYWWQISKKTQAELRANFMHAAAGKEVVYEVDVWIANQNSITILFSLRPVLDDLGNVIYIIPEGRPIDELVSTRNRYKSVLEGTNVGTWIWNVQTGETVFNERWAEMIGYSLEELNPISINRWVELAHPDDLAESNRRLQLCFERREEFYEMEARMKHKDGHWVWVFDTGKVFSWTPDGMPLMMYGTHQDITTRKKREIELAYQKSLLSNLYELSPIGISLIDYETGTFIDVNKKLQDLLGYSKNELLLRRYWDLTPEAYNVKEQEALDQMEQSGFYVAFEKEYIRKDGSRIPVLVRGLVIRDLNEKKLIWSFIQDISKEKEAEWKLREAITKLQAVLDASTQVSIIATDPSGTITLFNSGAEQMLGYRTSEIIGLCNPEIIHAKEEIQSHGKTLEEEFGIRTEDFDVIVFKPKLGRPETKEWTYIRKDGSRFPVLLSVTSIKEQDELVGYLCVATDITELKKAQSEIESLLEITKEQNDRLQNFAHIVSHNLRSHSAGISGLFELLKLEEPDYFNSKELLQVMEKGAENLKTTIDDLTDIVKINLVTVNFQCINLSEVIAKNIESLHSMIKESKFEIYNEISNDVWVSGVPAFIDSIVLNLFTNAIKYRAKERSGFLKITANKGGEFMELTLKDNGLGIDLEKHGNKLFGMYKTFHNNEDSRGVGLYITKNQIERMGGKIEVQSEVNKGTEFKVFLPFRECETK